MSARIREHVRSNVIGYIALFVALGGTAWAANSVGSSDVIDNSLQSIDLKDDAGVKSADVANDTATGGGLASADLRADSVGSSEVIDESLGGADIDESTLPVGGDLNGFLSGAQIVLNAVGSNEIAASSVGSSEVIDNSLQGLDINDSSLDVSNGIASSPDAGLCDPASGTFTACASTSLLQSTGASVLVIGSGAWFGTQGFGAADEGSCRIFRDGNQLDPPRLRLGQSGDQHNSSGRGDGFAIVTVDTAGAAGTHAWQLSCNQTAGNFAVADPRITVLAVEGS